MAEVNINLKCDLQHAVRVQYLDGNLFSQDAAANTINIEVTDGGVPAEIGGTVSANVIRPDGGTVAVTGGIIDGNIVSITLPAACYALVGMITIVVKLTDESTVTTLAAAVAYVYQSSTDTVVDPGTVMSSIQDLIDAIDTAVASIPADYSSLWTKLAPAFSSSTAYTAGQYVTYNSGLYRFTKAHAAGSWASGDVVAVNIGGELSDVKSALDNIAETYPVISFDFASGGITATGITNSNTNRIRSASSSSKTPVVQKGDCYFVSAEYLGVVHIYDSTTFNTSHHVAKVNDAKNGIIAIPDTYIGGYAAISISKTGHESDDISGDLATIASKVLYLRPALGNRQTDKTLSLTDYPADAKVTGDTINVMKNAILPVMDSFRYDWEIKKSIASNGNLIDNNNFARSLLIPVAEGNRLINLTPETGEDSQITVLMIARYNNGTFISGSRVTIPYNGTFDIPSGTDGIRFVYGYTSDNPSPKIMTRKRLDAYFGVKMLTESQPVNYIGDGEHPVYVAFGASTTEGCVHHYTGEDITVSAYNYPDYIGKVLNLKAFNLGVGSTGFLARGDRSSTHYGDTSYYKNICDSILANDDLLSKAKLITLMFGYGNDHYIGPQGSGRRFFIGEYTDYYPYDIASQTIEDFDKAAGLSAMIDGGATLMGCLNWSIKYISEKYPYAQLAIIFGSPSANDCRTISISENSETPAQGVAPYKITFTKDPYKDAEDHTSAEYGIYLINEELKKLKEAMDIPIVNLFYEGNAFNWYSTYAKKPDNPDEYALFSTKGTVDEPVWNAHPNDTGYLYFARYVAGKVISLFKH